MRVLVTGAFGYLGLAVVRGLEGHEVVACGRAPRNPSAMSALPPWAEPVVGDLAERVPVVLGERGPFDAVIHLAGGGGPKKCESDPIAAISDNVTATALLLDAARERGARRLLFSSTIAVYGTFRQPAAPYRPDHDAAPDDLYGSLKHAAECLWTAPRLGGGTALRLANVYGAGSGVDLGVDGAVERFARAAAKGGEISIFGTGAQRIDYVHIDDVVRAFRLALTAPALPPVVNVGGGRPVSIAELADACFRLGKERGTAPRIVRKPDPGGKLWPDRSLAIDDAREALGWLPQVSLDRGLGELIEMMARLS